MRMADGAVDVKNDIRYSNESAGKKQTLKKGKYLVEDKVSEGAYKPGQAEQYSAILDKHGKLETSAGGKVVDEANGIILVLPDEIQAGKIADRIHNANLNAEVHVGYRGPDGGLVIIR
jgi:hypothetical protein